MIVSVLFFLLEFLANLSGNSLLSLLLLAYVSIDRNHIWHITSTLRLHKLLPIRVFSRWNS